MKLFRRLSAILRSWMNSLAGKMEDPSKMLEAAVTDMDGQLEQAAGQVGRMSAELRRVERRHKAFVDEARAWEQKAVAAVQRGVDELAKQCLGKKAEAEKQAGLLAPQVEKQRDLVERMKADVRKMKSRIEEAKSQKTVLEARHKNAEAQKVVLTSMEKLDGSDASTAVSKLEAAVMQAESEAEATEELGRDVELEEQIAALQPTQSGVELDDALSSLRAKMGVTQAAAPPVVVDEEAREQVEQEEEQASLFEQSAA